VNRESRGTSTLLGVVIPTLNEEESLPFLLSDLRALPFPAEVIVVDGGSVDATAEVARREGCRTVVSPPGRGTQMNGGARLLETPWILFLHADSRLPVESARALAAWISEPSPREAAHFAFALEGRGGWRALVTRVQRVRERLTGLAYGDQGLLLSRARYEAIGGIPELPIMEDVEAVRRLRATGGIARIGAPLITSTRRYEEEGPLRAWLRNGVLLSLFFLGVAPARLSRWYRPRRTAAESAVPGVTAG
jgi:rSAM/selenodomain-associated transferase 2